MASLASGLKATDSFITLTLQKHLFREMKLSDTAVKNPEILKWIPLNKRYVPTGVGKIPINIFLLAALTVLHVSISLCAQKYQHIIRSL